MTSICPYIISSVVALTGNGFSLFSVEWQSMPSNNQIICLRYRVSGDPDWIVVNTHIEVDKYGNLVNGSQIILETAVGGVTYDVNAFNQCSSDEDNPVS